MTPGGGGGCYGKIYTPALQRIPSVVNRIKLHFTQVQSTFPQTSLLKEPVFQNYDSVINGRIKLPPNLSCRQEQFQLNFELA